MVNKQRIGNPCVGLNGRISHIRLDLISVDAGTQQRPLDEDVLNRYMALVADGVEFPPVEVVTDGPNFWLYDGFHRLECFKRRKQKAISAYVTEGTLRDAIWLSFSANRDHGLSRQKGVAKHIIEQILTDSSWSKKSLTAIAKHVGVTKQYVSLVKDELAQAHLSSTLPIDAKNGDSEPKTAQGSSTLPLSRAKEIEVQTKSGIPYTQRSQEKEHRAAEPLKDMIGRVIPAHLREVYQGREVIAGFVRDLTKLKNDLMKHVEARDPVFGLLNVTAFQAEYETLRRRIKFSMPYSVCVYCGGDAGDCTACHGFGFMNKQSFEVAPRELKL